MITYALNGLLMIAIPIGLAVIVSRRWKPGWRIWWIGIATFIISQVGHIPFNIWAQNLINQSDIVYWSLLAQQAFTAAFLGLSAGLFEEGARYLVLRLWIKDCRSWRQGFLFGAGHGGGEAIILGVLVLASYISMLAIRDVDLGTLVPVSQIEIAEQQIAAYWSAPWYDSLLGALERLFTIPMHIALALMVLQAFTRQNKGWLILAILYHAAVDGILVFLLPQIGAYWSEALVGGFALVSILIIRRLWQPEPGLIEDAPNGHGPVPITGLPPVEETRENLDDTRYQS
jgi:uncharacterized membrane protein YhfC